MTMCADCGRAPAIRGRLCEPCLETFAQDHERRHGLPPGGRDPDEVRHENRCRRGAAGVLLGQMTGNRDDEHAAMTIVLQECYKRAGLTPAAALVGPLLITITAYLVDAPGPLPPPAAENVVRCEPARWRTEFVERLRTAGMIAAAEAEVADDAELIRDCQATEAATVVMCGRLTTDQDLERTGWRLAEALAEHGSTAPVILLGPILGLINDHVRGAARQHLIDQLRTETMLHSDPPPDTIEGLT